MKAGDIMPRGGKRDGAGRKAANRVQISFRADKENFDKIEELIEGEESISKKAEMIFLEGIKSLENNKK